MTTSDNTPKASDSPWGERVDRFLDKLDKTNDPSGNNGGAPLVDTRQADALADLIDQRLKDLGETLRQEFAKTHEQYRQEMATKIRMQWILTGVLMLQAFFQWLAHSY